MIKADEDALICDLAETYHIFNYRELPLQLLATLSVGLREDSRIKMKLRNDRIDINTMLTASILDRLSYLVWFNSSDSQHNRNRPKSVLSTLMGIKEESDVMSFDTAEDFERARKRFIKEGN